MSAALRIEPTHNGGTTGVRYVTAYGATIGGAPSDLRIRRRRPSDRIAGQPTVEFDDEAFESVAHVKTRTPQVVSDYLDADRRLAVRRLIERYPAVEISGRFISLEGAAPDSQHTLWLTLQGLGETASKLSVRTIEQT